MGSVCASNSNTPAAVEQVKADAATPPPAAEEPAAEVKEEEAPPPAQPKLTIMICGARGLRRADWLPGMGTSDSFVSVNIKGKPEDVQMKTKTINNCLTPIWQEEGDIMEFNEGDDLEFSVWDEDVGKTPDSLGKVVMTNDMCTKGFNGELPLDEPNRKDGVKAYLRVKVKMAGMEDYPAGPASEFTIKFDKDPKVKALGLDVDETDGKHVYIINVKAGPFKAYNDGADSDKQLQNGDYMVKVNDKENNAPEMMDELKKKTSFEILVRRPEQWTICIDKKEAKVPLGLALPKKLTGNALLIDAVNAGPFQDWNDANPDQKVQAGDRIVSVNGSQVSGNKAVELQKKMLSAASFQAIVSRPYTPNSGFLSWWH